MALKKLSLVVGLSVSSLLSACPETPEAVELNECTACTVEDAKLTVDSDCQACTACSECIRSPLITHEVLSPAEQEELAEVRQEIVRKVNLELEVIEPMLHSTVHEVLESHPALVAKCQENNIEIGTIAISVETQE